jgi:hypothetical protein
LHRLSDDAQAPTKNTFTSTPRFKNFEHSVVTPMDYALERTETQEHGGEATTLG